MRWTPKVKTQIRLEIDRTEADKRRLVPDRICIAGYRDASPRELFS